VTYLKKGAMEMEMDKPAHVVNSMKQSPVLKGHPFLVLP
jgi:hypothetical protein